MKRQQNQASTCTHGLLWVDTEQTSHKLLLSVKNVILNAASIRVGETTFYLFEKMDGKVENLVNMLWRMKLRKQICNKEQKLWSCVNIAELYIHDMCKCPTCDNRCNKCNAKNFFIRMSNTVWVVKCEIKNLKGEGINLVWRGCMSKKPIRHANRMEEKKIQS